MSGAKSGLTGARQEPCLLPYLLASMFNMFKYINRKLILLLKLNYNMESYEVMLLHYAGHVFLCLVSICVNLSEYTSKCIYILFDTKNTYPPF